jgi:hypothetical protein
MRYTKVNRIYIRHIFLRRDLTCPPQLAHKHAKIVSQAAHLYVSDAKLGELPNWDVPRLLRGDSPAFPGVVQ